MKRADLEYDEDGTASAQVTPPLFGRGVTVRFFPDFDGDGAVSDEMIGVASDVGRLAPKQQPVLAAMLLEYAELCFESTDYGFDPGPGEDGAEANRRAFGIWTAADALASAGSPEAQVSGEDDGRRGRFAVLVFYPPWEDEHGCGVVVRDGELVGVGPSSVYVGEFDPDEA